MLAESLPNASTRTIPPSYGLKHLAERRAAKLSDGEVRYISNGALILAMVDAGFEFRKIEDTPNVYFNVSERAYSTPEFQTGGARF